MRCKLLDLFHIVLPLVEGLGGIRCGLPTITK